MSDFTHISWSKVADTIRAVGQVADEEGWGADAAIFERHFSSRPIAEYVDVKVAQSGDIFIFYRLNRPDGSSQIISAVEPTGQMKDQIIPRDMMGGLSSNVAQFMAYGLGGTELPADVVTASAARLFRCLASEEAAVCEAEATGLRKAVVGRELKLARHIWYVADKFIEAARSVGANPSDLLTVMRIEDLYDRYRPEKWPPVTVKEARENGDHAIEMLEELQGSNAFRDIMVRHGEKSERVVTDSAVMCPPRQTGLRWTAEVTYSFGGRKFRREEPRGRCTPNDVVQKP